MCPFDYTAVAGSGNVEPVNQVNHTSWVAVVTPTDRPKSVRNRCVIKRFCGVVCVLTFPFDISFGVLAFVIGLSQIFSFFLLLETLISSEYGLTLSGHVTVLCQWPLEKNTDYKINNVLLKSYI